jgi:hypothetical protein
MQEDEELAEIEANITSNDLGEAAPPEEEPEETAEDSDSSILETTEPEKKPEVSKGFQKRINKRTADYYREKNKREELEKKLAALEAQKPGNVANKPKEEDFDYDPAAYQEALIAWNVQQAVIKQQHLNKVNQSKSKADEVLEKYNAKVEKAGIEDFDEVVSELYQGKILGATAYEAILEQDNGPLIEYHLGKNLDLAAKIGRKTPAQQAAEIGKLSVKLAAPKGKKISNAPEPVKPAKSGGGGLAPDPESMDMDAFMEDDRF